MSDRWLRLVAAFVLAPLIASTLAGIVVVTIFRDPTEAPPLSETFMPLLNLMLMVTLVSAAIAVPTTLSVGLLAHAMFQRRGVTATWAYILTGAIAGALVPAVLALFVPNGSIFALYGVPIGALTALIAWLIRRPDRDTANPPTSAS